MNNLLSKFTDKVQDVGRGLIGSFNENKNQWINDRLKDIHQKVKGANQTLDKTNEHLSNTPVGKFTKFVTGDFGKEPSLIQSMVTRPGAEIAMSGAEALTGKKQSLPDDNFKKGFFGPGELKSYQSQAETGGKDTLVSAGMSPEMADKFVPWMAMAGIAMDVVPPGADDMVESGGKKIAPKVASKVGQITNTFGASDDLVQEILKVEKVAQQQQPAFEKIIRELGDLTGRQVEIGPVKTAQRMLEKVFKEEKGDVTKLMDANRSVAFVNNFTSDIENVTQEAKKFFGDRFVEVKDMNPKQLFIKRIINFTGPDGQVAEFMITTKPMWDAKMSQGDKLYHKFRSIVEELANPAELAEKKKLGDEMLDLYSDAYSKTENQTLKNVLGSSIDKNK